MTLASPSRRTFVMTDVNANNNKFWEIEIDTSGTVTSRNGRVGSAGQQRVLGQGQRLMASKIREKERKGYKEIEIVGATKSPDAVNGSDLISAAERDIGRGDPVISELVRDLAAMNRHQILAASGGKMDIDLSTGIISTPVGVVTDANIQRARVLLQGFVPFVRSGDFEAPDFISPLEEYLMLVPQKVGAQRGWHRAFINDVEALTRQGALLDQLESSISIATQRVADARGAVKSAPSKVFDVTLTLSEDAGLMDRVRQFYERGRQQRHASYSFRPTRIYTVDLGSMAMDYAADGGKLGGIQELWHGTRAHNVLSILKSGLIIPKRGGSIHVTGRMFGNGLYFSDQSTKSLNYAAGYWDGGSGDRRCFMFLADVAMGRHWNPDQTGGDLKPPPGYDSTFARGGRDGVLNNEMIVYRTAQANLKYLVEFQK